MLQFLWQTQIMARSAAGATSLTGGWLLDPAGERYPDLPASPADPSEPTMPSPERSPDMLAALDLAAAVPDTAEGAALDLAAAVPDTAEGKVRETPCEDMLLVQRVQAGDMAAFETLFHKYKAVIYRTALAITRDPGVAEEILQDCFYKTYLNIARIHGDTPLSPWLHRVAVNLSCNALKKRRFWLEPLENLAERLFSDPYHSPEQVAEQSELQAMMRELINGLPLKHRVVVVLHYLQDFSLPEIAYILNCPVGTVKSRLHYARKVLKIELEKRYQEETAATYGPAPAGGAYEALR